MRPTQIRDFKMFFGIDEVYGLYFVIIICVVILGVFGTLVLKIVLFEDDNIKSQKKEKTKNNK